MRNLGGRRGTALVVTLSLIALGFAFGVRIAEIRDRPKQYNVVYVLTDDQSVESLAYMPYTNGRDDWIRFDNAVINNPLCCPSRATILSGQNSHHTGVEVNRDAPNFDDDSTIATWLDGIGYDTAFIGKYFNRYPFGTKPYVPPGWDHWAAFTNVGYYGFGLYEAGPGHVPENRVYAESDYSTDVLTGVAIQALDEMADPFFLMLSLNSPHNPRTPAHRHEGAYADLELERSPNFNEEDVTDKPAWVRDLRRVNATKAERKVREQYESLLAVDEAMDSLFTALSDRHLLDDTVIVFMSDNGYAYGAHRWQKKSCPYEECVATPLLIRYPGVAGRDVSSAVSNADIAPTIAALAGVTPPPGRDGRSLLPLLTEPDASWDQGVLIHSVRRGVFPVGFFGVRTEGFKYVEYETGERELYDLRLDPYELDNVADTPRYREQQADLAADLALLRL